MIMVWNSTAVFIKKTRSEWLQTGKIFFDKLPFFVYAKP